MRFNPGHADDAAVEAAFNRHQRGDKGFGPALGPAAPEYLAARLKSAGRRVRSERSDWVLEKERDGALIAELTGGIAPVAEEMGVAAGPWLVAARAAAEARVSHLDLFSAPVRPGAAGVSLA